MMLIVLRTVLIWIVFNSVAAIGAESSVVVTIGAERLILPPPSDFQFPGALAPRLVRLGEHAMVPEDRLLAIFASPKDIQAEVRGNPARMDRYGLAQTTKELEQHQISLAQFAKYKADVRAELSGKIEQDFSDLRKNWAVIAKEYGHRGRKKPDLTLEDISPIGVVKETSVSLTALGLVSTKVRANGGERIHVTAMATSLVLVRRKVLWLQVFATFRTPADIRWVRDTSLEWTERTAQANQ
ncbi:MAG: hypothetical protein IT512_00230 [Rhodocyclaceae bacterium]|nr:hypothetical protein [Rhodocyclaceae bacterium]